MTEIPLTGGGQNEVTRQGNIVFRTTGPWAPSVHALLRHLEDKSFSGAPRVMGTGFDDMGRETLSYVEGKSSPHEPWTDTAIVAIGTLLKQLHHATHDFTPPHDAQWQAWCGRSLRNTNMVYGHGDFGPWNIICKDGLPHAIIDWENAGPVDALVELAHVCWLNVQLCDDDVATRAGLPPVEKRLHQFRLLVDAYGLDVTDRHELVQTMIDIATLEAAYEAERTDVTPDSTDIKPLWAIAWRTRAAAWMIKNRNVLNQSLF